MSYDEEERDKQQQTIKRTLKLVDRAAVSRKGLSLTQKSELRSLTKQLRTGVTKYYPASISAAENIFSQTNSKFKSSEQLSAKAVRISRRRFWWYLTRWRWWWWRKFWERKRF